MYALIDGNNFYASCERVFKPSYAGRPLVVLSANDGCAIARSEEAKALGIKMGQPLHEFRHLLESEGVICLSANIELYGEMSNRMMRIAAGLGPVQETYSIDLSASSDSLKVCVISREEPGRSAAALSGGSVSRHAWALRPQRRWRSCATTSPRTPSASRGAIQRTFSACATGLSLMSPCASTSCAIQLQAMCGE